MVKSVPRGDCRRVASSHLLGRGTAGRGPLPGRPGLLQASAAGRGRVPAQRGRLREAGGRARDVGGGAPDAPRRAGGAARLGGRAGPRVAAPPPPGRTLAAGAEAPTATLIHGRDNRVWSQTEVWPPPSPRDG